jgi:alpha-beta hydrolase superfamily lysophospholipase/SAM-dependent methyltransferase
MTRDAALRSFQTHDGVELVYRHWPASGAAPQGWPARPALVLLHRGHEHSGRLQHLVDEFELPGVDVYAWDARGHGLSPGERGHSPSFGTSIRDVGTFVDHLCARHAHAREEVALVAQSVGAVLAAAWVHDYAPRLRGLVLATPAFSVKLYVPFARPGLSLLRRLKGDFTVTSYVKGKVLTHDPERVASYDTDPLVSRVISGEILLGLLDAGDRLVADAQAIRTPTLLLVSGKDWVVRREPQLSFFERLGSATKECVVLPDFFHDTLGERDRSRALSPLRGFLDRIFRAPLEDPDRTADDRSGPSFETHRRLSRPLSPLSPMGFLWSLQRLGLRTLGRLSHGIDLGCRTGFDSGASLDHVYEDRAAGRLGVGRLVDRVYLDAPGWRGVRVRRRHLGELIRLACERVAAAGRTPHLLDPAAGHGRYLLDVLESVPAATALLRDLLPENVRDGSARIRERGLEGRVRFEQGDAFDPATLAALGASMPRPDVAVVSGLFELFAGNDGVRRSLSGLAAAIAPGGWLVYTNQPWHPQLEMIARLLTSHRGGAPWVMRCRSQREMDQLVEQAGFEKLEQRVEEAGLFTVSLARRNA